MNSVRGRRWVTMLLYSMAISFGADYLINIYIYNTLVWKVGVACWLCAIAACRIPHRPHRPHSVVTHHQLVGVRGFVLGQDGLLKALTLCAVWQPGVNEARCISIHCESRSTTPSIYYPPGAHCHCGFNVQHTLQELRNSSYGYDCAAVVEGWGRSRLHFDGWRSQYCRILALIDESQKGQGIDRQPVKNRIRLQAAAMRYDVPIITATQALGGLDEFGTSVSAELKEWVKPL